MPHPVYYSGDQTKKEMGGAFSTYGGEERCIHGSGDKSKERDHLEDLGV
jgi:hypothetical protein